MRWMRRLLWAVGVLLPLGIASWLAVPPLVKWQTETRLSDFTGRQVTVGKVTFHPWSLRLTVNELAIAGAPGSASAEPQLRIARLLIDADARSLLRLAPVVESLQIDAPQLRLARTADGHYDVDDVLQRLTPEPGQERGETPHFALYNVELRGGELLFDDVPFKRQHHLSGLTLALPFLSNLPSQVDVKVSPRLAFTLDGATYDSGAEAVPFASSRSGTLTLRVAALDVEPYLAYVPATLPVRLQRGHVSADIALDFAAPEQGEFHVSVRGTVAASDLAIAEPGGTPLLAVEKAALELKDVQPLARKLALGALRIDGMEIHLARDAHGVVSVQRLVPAEAASAGAAAVPATAPRAAWQASLDSLELAGARVLWNDSAVKPASSWVFDGLALSARQLRLPASEAAPFSLKATLRPQGDPSKTLAALSLDGQASEAAASVKFELSGVTLAAVAPYINAASMVQVAGTGATNGQFEWTAATPAQAQRMLVVLDQLTLDGTRVDDPTAGQTGQTGQTSKTGKRGETLSMQRVQLTGVAVDLASQSITVASAKLQRPQVRLERSADGVWNLLRLAGPTPLAESERPLVRAAAEATWQFRLDDLSLDDGRVRLVDAAPAPGQAGAAPEAVRLSIDTLRLGLQGVQVRGDRLVTTPSLQFSARIAGSRGGQAGVEPGLVEWRGRFGLQPLLASGELRVERFPLQAVQAYVAHDLGVRLRHADAGFRGEVSLQDGGTPGLRADASGDVLLTDLILDSRRAGAAAGASAGDTELLSWQSFAINGLGVAVRPDAVPKLAIRDATLSDFFARLVLTEEGRLNLQDVALPSEAAAAGAAAGTASAPVAPAPAASAPSAARRLPVELELGGLHLAGGRVEYTDDFVKPNYSAALTELNGDLGAFRTGSGEPATLQLRGRVAGTGLLEIGGRLKPGAVPRELDIAAKATDIELAPLSTYSGKYAGYAIERGKLSVDVRYRIERDGQLEASHQVVLNQLSFGERVESPTATKLPVLLAVALLKDRNGVIDINLPVSGTLSDPQFSVGPIIWKLILNLLAKALTAPFALLSGGGGPDMSVVAFQPGASAPTEAGKAAMDKVAKALADRPALKMTLVGEADAEAERDAYQRAALEQRLLQERRREQLRASGAASAPDAVTALGPADRGRLVKQIYRQTDLSDKPRNALGRPSDIPTEEMEALLRKHVDVGPEAMRELALQRGLAVRGALIAKGLPSDRLFLGDPRLRAAGAADAAWTPQVKLTLDTQ